MPHLMIVALIWISSVVISKEVGQINETSVPTALQLAKLRYTKVN